MVRGIAPSSPVAVAGIDLGQWLRTYDHTHAGGARLEWPDGGAYLDQDNILIEMWELIDDEIRLLRKSNGKR